MENLQVDQVGDLVVVGDEEDTIEVNPPAMKKCWLVKTTDKKGSSSSIVPLDVQPFACAPAGSP